MGGIADYSGALVLQWPIREATRVAAAAVASAAPLHHVARRRRYERTCDVPLDSSRTRTVAYEHVPPGSPADPARHWAAYVAGVFHVLAREHGVRFDGTGPPILIESDVPEGKGVSSSAALEAATMEAVVAAWHVLDRSAGSAPCVASRSRT